MTTEYVCGPRETRMIGKEAMAGEHLMRQERSRQGDDYTVGGGKRDTA